MPRRFLLSPEQRDRLFGIPTDPAEMAKYYVLNAQDLALVRAKRRSTNRLGFAVQRLRSFRLVLNWRACLRVGADAAWAADRGEPIVQAMLTHRRAEGVLVPAAVVLKQIGLAARVRARRRVSQILGDGLADSTRAALDKSLTLDPALRRSRFARLRGCAESPASTNLLALLDRLEYVRAFGVDATRVTKIHPSRLGRLLAEAAVMTVQHIADLEPVRRTAILVAQVIDLETRLTDATLAMFEKYMGSLFSKA